MNKIHWCTMDNLCCVLYFEDDTYDLMKEMILYGKTTKKKY